MSFHIARRQFDEQGEPVNAPVVERAMNTLLDRLKWWAQALMHARETTPYVQVRA